MARTTPTLRSWLQHHPNDVFIRLSGEGISEGISSAALAGKKRHDPHEEPDLQYLGQWKVYEAVVIHAGEVVPYLHLCKCEQENTTRYAFPCEVETT